MNAPFDLSIYRETLLFLVTAGVVAPLFFRIRVSPVLGYLFAGVALGPYGLGRLVEKAAWLDAFALTNVDSIKRIAAFGVVVLLFTIGLELSFERLMRMRRLVFALGLLQVVLSTLALGAIAYWLGQGPAAAVMIGAALSLSSTAIVIPVLADEKRLGSMVGRYTFAVLLFQDLAVAPLLVLATVLAGGAGDAVWESLVLTLAPAVLALAGVIVVGRLVLRPLFHSVAMTRSPEFFMAACLLVVLGAALAAAASGLSMALGAFVAGLLLAETEYRREIEVTIEPFKGLLLGLYFVSVGAELNLDVLAAHFVEVLGLTVAFVALKAVVLFALARAFGASNAVAGEAAMLLGPGGEFAFVMIAAAAAGGVVAGADSEILLVAVALSMVFIPLLGGIGAKLAKRPQTLPLDAETRVEPPDDGEGRVVIVGYGRVGALIGEMLAVHTIPFIAVDADPVLIARERRAGKPVYFGDASREEFLRRCGVETARAVIVTMDMPAANEAVVEAARRLRPDITLIARARDAAHARKLYELGVTDAVPETIEASLQLSEAALVDLGVPMGLVIASVHQKRDEYRKLLIAAGAGLDTRGAKPRRKL